MDPAIQLSPVLHFLNNNHPVSQVDQAALIQASSSLWTIPGSTTSYLDTSFVRTPITWLVGLQMLVVWETSIDHRIHWSMGQTNGNSIRIIKDDLSASLRYCTVPFMIFTSFWQMYRPSPSLETPWLWWNISWIRSSGIPGAGWVILPC